MIDQYPTRYTLLHRAADLNDEYAWEEIVGHYRCFILYILREMGVPPNDLEDVVQQILIALVRDLERYDRDRARFRTWFGTVIRNVAMNYFRKQKTRANRLCNVNPDMDLLVADHPAEIDMRIEREWATYIGDLAMKRVRKVFQGQAVEVFERSLDGAPAAEIAKQTGLSISSVYTLRKRVKKRLYLEIRALVAELEGA